MVEMERRVWRWQGEYNTVLFERHYMQYESKSISFNIGDAVMIKGEDKKRDKWKIRIVNEIFKGRYNEVRGVKAKRLTGYLGRPIHTENRRGF